MVSTLIVALVVGAVGQPVEFVQSPPPCVSGRCPLLNRVLPAPMAVPKVVETPHVGPWVNYAHGCELSKEHGQVQVTVIGDVTVPHVDGVVYVRSTGLDGYKDGDVLISKWSGDQHLLHKKFTVKSDFNEVASYIRVLK